MKHYVNLFIGAMLLASITANASDSVEGGHRIVLGDTLWRIAERYYGTPSEWSFLQQLNTISEPTNLQPGYLLDVGMVDSFPLTVLYLSGNAWFIQNSAETRLTIGQTIEAGVTLLTGRDTALTLQMNDGARIVVPSMSRVTLKREGEKGVTLFLEQGEVESYVPTQRMLQRPYNIETYNGVLGVRGTHFQARYESSALLASVYEGNVAAGNHMVSEQAFIAAGRGARIGNEGNVQVVTLLPPPEYVNISSLASGEIKLDVLSTTAGARYRAQIANDPGFLNILRDERTEIGQLHFTALPPGFYHLRIAEIDELGIEGYSTTQIFYHHSEQVNLSLEDNAWLFEWNHRPHKSYTLQLATDRYFNTVLLNYTPHKAGILKVDRLPFDEIYWRISSFDELENTTNVIGNGILNDAEH